MSAPCDVCCRVHRGPRCKPEHSRRICLTIPQWLDDELRDRIPWGERSAWFRQVMADALEDV